MRWRTPWRDARISRGARRSGYSDMIRFVGWISVSVDTLHLGTLHHFFVGAGNPNLWGLRASGYRRHRWQVRAKCVRRRACGRFVENAPSRNRSFAVPSATLGPPTYRVPHLPNTLDWEQVPLMRFKFECLGKQPRQIDVCSGMCDPRHRECGHVLQVLPTDLAVDGQHATARPVRPTIFCRAAAQGYRCHAG